MSESLSNKRLMCDAKTPDEAKKYLVLCNRIMANEGILDGLGHVSIRNPNNPETFFQSCSQAPEFVSMDDIMEIALDGTVIRDIEGKKPYGERFLHGAVLNVRRDISVVYHGHPLSVIPFSVCRDIPMLPVMNYGSIFYSGFGYFDSDDASTGMLINSLREGEKVSEAIGDKYACLLRGHGVVTVAENIPQLVIDTIWLIHNAKVQLDCLAIGGNPKCCTKEEGYALRQFIHGENALSRCWNYYWGRVKKAMPDIKDLQIICVAEEVYCESGA